MPRPRILCSPRSKPQTMVENINQRPPVVTISESEEPDCEIIKIEDDKDDKKKISLQVQGVAEVQYRGSQCLPSMLSLQFLQATPLNTTGKAGGQNVVMVVRSSPSQVFNPTLCTLEKIENSTEISEIRQVVGMQQNPGSSGKNVCSSRSDDENLKNSRKNVSQSICTHISAENRRQINERRVSYPTNESAIKLDSSLPIEADDYVLQEPSTSYSTLDDRRLSVVEIDSDVSTGSVDSLETAGTLNLRPEEKFSDTSGSRGNRNSSNFAPKNANINSNNYKTTNTKISLSKTSIHKINLIKNGTTAGLRRNKVAGNVNSSVKIKAANSGPKRFGDNKNTVTFVRKETRDGRNCAANPETATSMEKAEDDENSVATSKRSMLQSKKYTNDENTSEYHEFFSPAIECFVEIDNKNNSPIALESIASGIKNCEAAFLWNLNCIVCNRNFSDRTKLHKHATLTHPDVQILFCEFCNESFLTQEKLEAHHVKNCKSEITEILETIVIEDEEDDPLPSQEISGNFLKNKIISQTNTSLKTQSMTKNKPLESQKLKTRRCSGGILIRKKRGRPRTNFANFVATYKYVEEEVITYAAEAKKKELVTAEIKKLVVPIARLEDSMLKKYLEKRTESPLSDHKDEEGSSPKNFRKKKRRRPQRNYNKVGNLKRAPTSTRKIMELKRLKTNLSCAQEIRNNKFLRHTDKIVTRNSSKRTCSTKSSGAENRGKIVVVGAKKRPIYTDIDDNSDDFGSQYIPVVDKDDSGINKRSIIRKLPSRSSAASFVSLKTGMKNEQWHRVKQSPVKTYGEWILRNQKVVNPPDCIETSVKKRTEPERCRVPSEPSNKKTVDNTKLNVVDHVQFGKISKNLEENRQQNNEKTDISKISVARKTYLPSKRKELNATKMKQRCDPMSTNLCLMCKELLQLMNQLAGHFDGNKANKISVKCPLCNLYFISMFYLKKHVSKYHLHCQNQFPAQLSKSLMLVKSENDENLDCETEILLALECHHCDAKFSEEKDLVHHVFKRHDSPIFHEDTATDFPYYVDDLPSSYFQTSNRSNSIDSSLKVKPKKSSKPTNIMKKSPSNSAGNGLRSLRTEAESYCRGEIPSTSKPTKEDHAVSDRDYLLKQLLSDDSDDSFDNPETATSLHNQTVQKISRKITVKNEIEFTRPQCQICDKEFERTQDLLIHSLQHDFPDAQSEESNSNAMQDGINCLFADSIEYHWVNEGLAASMTLESQTEESETTAPIPKRVADDLDTGDILFVSSDESNDFALIYKIDEPESETVFQDRKLASLASTSASRNKKTDHFCIKLISGDTEPQTKKLKVLQEFLETEKGSDNPDETDSTRKLPIECSKCNRKFPNQASLNEHLFFLHDDSLKATVLTDVVSPMSHTGDANSREPRQWRCDECVHNFKLLQSYGRHRYFVHGDDELVHVCENCFKVMTTVTMVNVHICTDVASYNCRTCNETFSTGMSLRLHNMYKHKETEGPHKCLPCNKKFLTNSMLKRHEKWKHRFMRPYRPRKSSPVYMATPLDVPTKSDEHFGENEMDSGCDQEYVDMEYEFTRKEAAKRRKRDLRNPEFCRNKIISQEKNAPEQESRNLGKDPLGQNSLITYIYEDEIIQCTLCRLYCLSMTALRTHMANSHSIMGEICRICEKMYSKGKLIRHMIDQHINPCETYTEDEESIWNVGKNVEEKDAEELIRMLGMSRFISLCEYQRFSESTQNGTIRCPNCTEKFETCEDYKSHFLMKHDIMCALCNIEFKSGDKAAVHKTEDHGSVDSYIWFADQTIGALTAATNFSEAAEKSFIEMISRDSDESNDENEDEDREEENQTCGQYFAAKNDDDFKLIEKMETEESLSEFFDEQYDQKLMIVVTDEDLRSYGIGTRNPNIWGLASKISSTSTELTPKDVKVMLDSYFGK